MTNGNNDLKSSRRKASDSHLKLSTTTKMFVLLIVIFLITFEIFGLYMVFSTESIPYFLGYAGLSAVIISFLAYFTVKITRRKRKLFDDEYPESDSEDDTLNPRLENLLQAEQNYYKKKSDSKKKRAKTTRTKVRKIKSKDEEEDDEKESKQKSSVKKDSMAVKVSEKTRKPKGSKKSEKTNQGVSKKIKIGSIPIEESIYEERVRLKRETTQASSGKAKKKVTTFLCPDCGGKELYYEAGLISGYKYHCKDCDYIGSLVIEKDFKIDD